MSGSSLSMKARVLRPFCPMFQVTMRTDSPTNGDDTLHPGEIGRGFATCIAAATSQQLAYPPASGRGGGGWMATAPKAAIESRIKKLAAQLQTAEAKATGYRG